ALFRVGLALAGALPLAGADEVAGLAGLPGAHRAAELFLAVVAPELAGHAGAPAASVGAQVAAGGLGDPLSLLVTDERREGAGSVPAAGRPRLAFARALPLAGADEVAWPVVGDPLALGVAGLGRLIGATLLLARRALARAGARLADGGAAPVHGPLAG